MRTLDAKRDRQPFEPESDAGGRRRRRQEDYAGVALAEGFTLLEVLIASAIFFLMAFAVLELTARGLRGARSLQLREADAGLLAAAMSLTNRLEEGVESGDFEDIAPGLFPDYSWAREVWERESNGMFQVDFVVVQRAGKGHGSSETKMSVLMFRPGSPAGSRFKAGP
jgi:prepilin-type N-terminal cleavage/methylation domain-containing protein